MSSKEIISLDGKKWVKLLELSKLTNRKPFLVELPYLNNLRIVLLLLDGQIFAFDDFCPHQHQPKLHLGFVENGCIVCPEHGWAFPLLNNDKFLPTKTTGKLKTYDIILDNNFIYLNIDSLTKEKWKLL